MTIRALIVDDEPLARQRLQQLTQGQADLDVIGECDNGVDACARITRDRPDLVFLDVQMPEMDGFAVLHHLPRERLPLVIFTTAFDRHAARAFEAHALDYLLKPIRPERFLEAVARVRALLADRATSLAAQGLLDLIAERQGPPAMSARPRYVTRLTVRTDDKVIVVKVDDVDSIESAGNYVAIHVGVISHILRDSLSALEARLDPTQFLRISRSAMVNLARVKELHPMFKGEHLLVLHGGRRLAMTRGLREIEQALRFV